MFDGDDIAKMIFGGMGRGWGRRRRHWGGMGGMGGWVIPAMIIGRIIEEATRQHNAGQSPAAPPPFPASPPAPRSSAAPPSPWAETTETAPAAAPAPPPRIECRYCGREVPAGARTCLGCGAPQRI
jgi:hypothetical protein